MSFTAKLTPAIRSVRGSWHLHCHVKPGVDSSRNGISAVTEDAVKVCVAAQAKGGEANDAVLHVIRCALKARRDDVTIVRGLQSRVKIVAVSSLELGDIPTNSGVQRVKRSLLSASCTY
ncbi:hypothetical protein T440DRAFT_472841 [Plenodomus tracheiphilus IPT5]|uniref:YggU-like protein n=1 Tax=Plenodomus tracheiphilus IPT5 TaxID=1408161 RepID=A0A6A7ASV8_9PLEO|nr:hypothetical protein T440DRAFT_472841 [Plenodomus tracheiphilus IPT5]